MSTITVDLQQIFGTGVASQVLFTPEETPFINGTALVVSGAQSIQTAANGIGSAVLQPGRYVVSFPGLSGNTDSLTIGVPNDGNTYNLTSLINSGTAIPSPPLITFTSAQITDSTASGRALLTAANTAAQWAELGLGSAASLSASAITVTSAQITDGTAAGRALLTSANAAAQIVALGLNAGGLVKIDGVGNVSAAVPFVDFVPPVLANQYRFTAAHGFELFNATTGLWNAPTVSGQAGSEVAGVNAGDS